MTTFREALKEATVAALLNQTAAGARVYSMRTIPRQQVNVPCITVYTMNETGQGYGPHGPPSFRRVLTLSINVDLRGLSDAALDEAADTMIEDIERSLLQNPDWVGLSEDVDSITTDLEIDSQVVQRQAGLTIDMGIVYRTVHEPIISDDLKTVEVEADPVGSDPDSAVNPGVSFTFDHEDS